MAPLVSVIVPVYNVSPYLHQCMDSIVNQTLKDIEIICVDDGSTDDSLAILQEYAKHDSRITILQQENKGAGAARNLGMTKATGKYLSFLDSDDEFSLSMLEKIYLKCDALNADIGIFNYYIKNVSNGVIKKSADINPRHLPSTLTFSYRDMPKYILTDFCCAAWNKLYRRKFLLEFKLDFHEIHRTNDLYFTRLSLMLAKKITVLDEPLMNYRVGMKNNCQSSTYKYPFDFYDTLFKLYISIIRYNLMNEIKQSYVNLALWICIGNINLLREKREEKLIYNFLKREGFKSLGLDNDIVNYTNIYCKRNCYMYKLIMSLEYDKYKSLKITYTLKHTIDMLYIYLDALSKNLRRYGISETAFLIIHHIINKMKMRETSSTL